MRWVNFNISMPFSDSLFGTLETEDAWRAERDRRARAPGNDGGEVLPAVKRGAGS
jgi:hypothetical protein